MEDIEFSPPESDKRWQIWAVISTGLALAMILHTRYLWRAQRVEEVRPAGCDASSSRRFRMGRVGGAPSPCLNRAMPDEIAETLASLERTPALRPAVHEWLNHFKESGAPFRQIPGNREA